MWKKLKRSKTSHKTDKTPAAASPAKVDAAPIAAPVAPPPAPAAPAPIAPPVVEPVAAVAEPTPAAVATPEVETAPATAEPATAAPADAEPAAAEMARPESALDRLIAEITAGAAFSQGVNLASPPYRLAVGMSAEAQADPESEIAYVRLKGGKPKAFSGAVPDGYAIRLPDEFERAASGQKVAVSVIARSAGDTESKFAISYSTNEVGNSGWRWQTAGVDWAIHRLELGVPPMKNGNGDFVGFLAGVEGAVATDICHIALHIL